MFCTKKIVLGGLIRFYIGRFLCKTFNNFLFVEMV